MLLIGPSFLTAWGLIVGSQRPWPRKQVKTAFHDLALAVYAERAGVVVAQVRSAVPELMESVPDQGHHAVLLSRTSSSTSTTVSPPALSRGRRRTACRRRPSAGRGRLGCATR